MFPRNRPKKPHERATEAGGNLSSPVDEGSSSTRHGTNRAAHDQRGEDENGKTGLETNSAQIPVTGNTTTKGKGKATGGGRAFQVRKSRRRDGKRQSAISRLGESMRRSVVLNAIGRAALAIGRRQIRAAEYRFYRRLNPFRNWGGEPMRKYRRIVTTARRVGFYGRLARNFSRDLNRPKLQP